MNYLEKYNSENLIILYSGGMGSFLAAYYIKKYLGRTDDVKLLFTDTNSEDEGLYTFINETSDFLGYPLTRIADGRDVFEVFIETGYMGNTRIDPCSQQLKRDMSKKFLRNFSPENTSLVFGIDLFESDRLDRLRERYKFPVLSPSVDFFLDRQSLEKEALAESGISKPRLYKMGFSHNNCAGFCVKAGQSHYKLLLEKDPERYEYFVKKENEVYEKVSKARPFLRVTVNGELKYMKLEEFRDYLNSKPKQLELFDYGACSCFL